MSKSKTLTVRLSDEAWETLRALQKKLPYNCTFTSIVERGIVLADNEMDEYLSLSEKGHKK